MAVAGQVMSSAWEKEAQAAGLTASDIARLREDKLLVTNPAFYQMFSAYLHPKLPIFVTSDSLLNAFHILYEESILRLEKAQAMRLTRVLRLIWNDLTNAISAVTGDPGLIARARERAMITIAVARRLIGNDRFSLPVEVERPVASEVQKVIQATAIEMPSWLGEVTAEFGGLDYSRFKPCGFYTHTPELERFFRASAWLQAIPFHMDRDDELLAAIMIAGGLGVGGRDWERAREISNYSSAYEGLLGQQDGPEVCSLRNHAMQETLHTSQLAGIRERILKYGSRDWPLINDTVRPTNSDRPALTLRVLSARRTPDALLFGETTRASPGDMPSGLHFAAFLGSDHASGLLGDLSLMRTIQEARSAFDPDQADFYTQYLACISTLFDAADDAAPAFFSSTPWKIKNLQTALGGWVQLRHTWALQAKPTTAFGGKEDNRSGFVEPNPEFFGRLAALGQSISVHLHRTRAFTNADADPFSLTSPLAPLWRKLESIALRLESLAHKQLRGLPFNDRENAFLECYGSELASIMFSSSSSGLLDVTPRIADVYSDSNDDPPKNFHIATARAMPLYVLYPAPKGEVLCRGAVLPYREFVASGRLSDDDWKELLDSSERPSLPEWLTPLYTEDAATEPHLPVRAGRNA